jgi:Tol biopolymer transport system component
MIMRRVVATALSATLLVLACTGDAGGPTSSGYSIAADGGDGQTGLVGEALPISPSVRITDRNGNPVAHVDVTFLVSTGGGSVSGANVSTNADGRAAVGHWTLGSKAGSNSLRASSADAAGSAVSFLATGTAGPAATLERWDGDSQSVEVGTAVPVLPAVRAADAYGNPVGGLAVTFEVTGGGGQVSGAVKTTASNGEARVGGWTLGTTPGSNTLRATAAGLAASPVVFRAHAVPPAASLSGVLVFTPPGLKGLALISADGTNYRTLTTPGPGKRDYGGVWAPGGDRILFVRTDIVSGGEGEIHVINADGTNLIRLSTPSGDDYAPTWSPDGQRIAFVHFDFVERLPQIYVIKADGADLERLSPRGTIDLYPIWSPDGQRIAFANMDLITRINQVYLMNADGTNRVQLTALMPLGADPVTWSPDGGQIAFTTWGGSSYYDIHVMNADGTNVRAISASPGYDASPGWSPEGSLIAYASEGNILVINADGTNRRQLTSRPNVRWSYSDFQPGWSPDGRGIVFIRQYDCDPFDENGGPPCVPDEIRTVQLSAPLVSRLVTQGDDPSWRP